MPDLCSAQRAAQSLVQQTTRRHFFRECGLEPVRVFKWDREPPYSLRDFLWYVERPRDMFRMLAGPLIPTNLANHLGFLLRRAPGGPS